MLQITKPLSSVVRIQKARTTLLLDHPFFGTLLFRPGSQLDRHHGDRWRLPVLQSAIRPADYSWTRPNRRHVWTGLYLPGIVCEGVGEICIAVDCSGSINARQLGCSRPRSAPSSPVNSLASSMFCTSTLKCRSRKRTIQDCGSS
jgi:hypothetical protein